MCVQTDVTILVTCPVGSKTLVCGFGVVIRLAARWGSEGKGVNLPDVCCEDVGVMWKVEVQREKKLLARILKLGDVGQQEKCGPALLQALWVPVWERNRITCDRLPFAFRQNSDRPECQLDAQHSPARICVFPFLSCRTVPEIVYLISPNFQNA